MKEEYQKPVIVSTEKIGGVFPAGLPSLVAGAVAGVAAATQVKKMINGRTGFQKHLQLVEVGVAI